MPHSYVSELAKKHNMSVEQAEEKWEAAKSKAAEEGKKEDYAVVTRIFQNMMGEKTAASTFLARASTVVVRRRK